MSGIGERVRSWRLPTPPLTGDLAALVRPDPEWSARELALAAAPPWWSRRLSERWSPLLPAIAGRDAGGAGARWARRRLSRGADRADPDGWPERGRTGMAGLALAARVPVSQWGAREVLQYDPTSTRPGRRRRPRPPPAAPWPATSRHDLPLLDDPDHG